MSGIRDLKDLIHELNLAETESLDEVGPITSRFHQAIINLCTLVDIPNQWNLEVANWEMCQTKGHLLADNCIYKHCVRCTRCTPDCRLVNEMKSNEKT